jgi:hypothetical protein
MRKFSIGEFRTRVRFKANTPASDGAGGYTDSFAAHDLQVGALEVWAHVELKSASRQEDMKQTTMSRRYKITIRGTFGYVPSLTPKKNMHVEIVGYTTNDATVQGVIWDDWSNYWVIEAEEKL